LILQIMAGLLVIGFFANLLVRPVAERFWMKEQPNTAMHASVERSERENGMNRGTKDTSQHKTPPNPNRRRVDRRIHSARLGRLQHGSQRGKLFTHPPHVNNPPAQVKAS
jgi:hypothetical protein